MNTKSTVTLVFALVLTSLAIGLSGCQTTEGVGRDLEDAGEAIQEGSRDARR